LTKTVNFWKFLLHRDAEQAARKIMPEIPNPPAAVLTAETARCHPHSNAGFWRKFNRRKNPGSYCGDSPEIQCYSARARASKKRWLAQKIGRGGDE
jgi:hypothetical protein